jgi:hypothetical protein
MAINLFVNDKLNILVILKRGMDLVSITLVCLGVKYYSYLSKESDKIRNAI